MNTLLVQSRWFRGLALVWASLAILTSVTPAKAAEYPELTGAVVDQANLLSTPAWAELETDLRRHRAEYGHHVVVATVPSLDGVNIAQYALGLARHWQLGDQGVDNGVLILIAERERSMRIEVGYGLEGTLTDARADSIIQREIRPALQRGDFDTGLRNGVAAVFETLRSSDAGSAATGLAGHSNMVVPLLFAGLFAIAHFFRKRIGSRSVNTVVVAGFIGVFVNVASGMWYAGAAAGIIAALVLYKRGLGAARAGQGATGGAPPHYDRYHDRLNEPQHQHNAQMGRRNRSHSGSNRGGGGSFGGGGASGRW